MSTSAPCLEYFREQKGTLRAKLQAILAMDIYDHYFEIPELLAQIRDAKKPLDNAMTSAINAYNEDQRKKNEEFAQEKLKEYKQERDDQLKALEAERKALEEEELRLHESESSSLDSSSSEESEQEIRLNP